MYNTKRILLIIGFVLITIIIGLAIYFVLFKGKTSFFGLPDTTPPTSTVQTFPGSGVRQVVTTTGTVVSPGTLPSSGAVVQDVPPSYYQPKLVTQLTDDYSVFPSLNSSDGNMRYYNSLEGKFYKITTDGSIKNLSDKTFYNASKVTWATTKNKAVIEYPDDSKIIYNFDKSTQVSLPRHWEDFSFSPESSEIAAKSIGIAPENRWLVSMRDDGTGVKTIEPMGRNAQYVNVDWSPSRQVVAFSKTGRAIGSEREEIYLIGLNKENFKSLTVEGLGFESKWSSSGTKLIYSVYSGRSDYKPELWVVGAYGDTINSDRKLLNINTWAEKCTFGNDTTIYCAVPKTLPTGAGFSPAIANSTPDNLYKIDLNSGLRTPIQLDANYTIETVSYNAKDNKIFFTDKSQSGIFEVKL